MGESVSPLLWGRADFQPEEAGLGALLDPRLVSDSPWSDSWTV